MTAARAQAASPKLQVLSRREFLALADHEPQGFLLEGLFPRAGMVALVGDAFAGKTELLAALAAAMAGPGKLAGLAVEQGRLLYCYLEHAASDFRDKLRDAERGAGVRKAKIKFVRPPPELDLGDVEQMTQLAALAESWDASAVVIDSMRRLGNFNENDSQDTKVVRETIQRLSGEGKRVVIVVHHLSRKGDPRGSTDIAAMVDSVVSLSRCGDSVKLRAQHHFRKPFECRLLVKHEGGVLAYERADDTGAGNTTGAALRDAIVAACPSPGLGAKALRDAVRKSGARSGSAAIDKERNALVAEGALLNVGSTGRPRYLAAKKRRGP